VKRALVIAAFVACSCSGSFAPKNQILGVRALAVRADLPYARPGESVRVEALVHDGRVEKPEPLRVFWFPSPCFDPPRGLYYGCYPGFESAFPLGVDLAPSLHEGNEVAVTIPADALTRAGATVPSATAFVFMIACAGHVERVTRPSDLGPNALPFGCFSADRRQQDAGSFVFGFTRVFVFESRRNVHPEIRAVIAGSTVVDPGVGITVGRCADADQCSKPSFDVLFDDASAELDPDALDAQGNVGRETLYVDWFTTVGKFADSRRILFDPHLGRSPKTSIAFEPPVDPGRGVIWAVLHDNRGGTTWRAISIEVQ
jgi:hypothetical protein